MGLSFMWPSMTTKKKNMTDCVHMHKVRFTNNRNTLWIKKQKQTRECESLNNWIEKQKWRGTKKKNVHPCRWLLIFCTPNDACVRIFLDWKWPNSKLNDQKSSFLPLHFFYALTLFSTCCWKLCIQSLLSVLKYLLDAFWGLMLSQISKCFHFGAHVAEYILCVQCDSNTNSILPHKTKQK